MKYKKIWIFTVMIFVLITLNTICFSMDKSNINNESLWLNNINDKDIKIEIESVDIINKNVFLDKQYDNYVIITMNVKNMGLDEVELSNINYSIYQQNKILKTFIQSKKNYLGFVGTLSSGDKKNITICAVIDDKKSPIYAEFENLSDPLKEKITKKICL